MAEETKPRKHVLHYRTAADTKPQSSDVEYGEICMSYSHANPSLYIKDSEDNIVRFVNQSDLDSVEDNYDGKLTEKLDIDTYNSDQSTKQDKLVEGYGIKIDENNEISTTLDITLIRIVTELPTEDIDDNKIYLLSNSISGEKNVYIEYIHHDGGWEILGEYKSDVDLTGYLKEVDADKKYMSKNAKVVMTGGSLDNYGNNGQAFLAIRELQTGSITGKKINGAAFGVKLDGTAAFSHKTYDAYDVTTGKTTGARNTAVMTFSGPTGLRYANNTGSTSDVSENMFRYVGIIDTDLTDYRVYSKKKLMLILKH